VWFEIKGDEVFLSLKVQPNASKNRILGEFNGMLKVAIKAPPVEGSANKELKKFFAKEFSLPKGDIEIVKGETSKQKLLKLPLTPKLQTFLKGFDEKG